MTAAATKTSSRLRRAQAMTAFSIVALRLVRVGARRGWPQLVLTELPGPLGHDPLSGLEALEHRDPVAVLVSQGHFPPLELLATTEDVHEPLALGLYHCLLGDQERLDPLARVEPHIRLLADAEYPLAVGHLEDERGGSGLAIDDCPEVDQPAGKLSPRGRGSVEERPHVRPEVGQVLLEDRDFHPHHVQ